MADLLELAPVEDCDAVVRQLCDMARDALLDGDVKAGMRALEAVEVRVATLQAATR